MRLSLKAAIGCLVALVVPLHAAAATVDDAVKALKASPVYVALGTEKTDSETSGRLAQKLNDDDNIVIVMLPAATVEDPVEIAKQLDEATGQKKIIGLSVGDQLDDIVGYSSLLPPGVASDQMRRARSVSTNNVETLSTFISNIHDWQAQHPEAKASRPVSQKKRGFWTYWWLMLMLCVSVVVGCLLYAKYRLNNQDPENHVQLKRSPDRVRDVLERVLKLRSRIEDAEMHSLLTQICRDTEAYFQRMHRHGARRELDANARTFVTHLESVEKVLEQYIDIQDHPRYFHQPYEEMAKGRDAIAGFAEYVLNNIKRGGKSQLTHFNVDTDILSAQRYS